MKNQYFGDINDYKKYGLIRQLDLKTIICWMLTPNNDNNDGGQIKYLDKPYQWAKYDKFLFQYLEKHKRNISDKQYRSVSIIQNRDIIPKCEFFNEIICDDGELRNQYFKKLFNIANDADLIFFDPDIGLEALVKCGNRRSSQYLYWNEVKTAYDKGFSVLIYQHRHRSKTVENMAEYSRVEALKLFRVTNIFIYKTPSVLFLLIARDEHRKSIIQANKRIKQAWGNILAIH
ncbi:MAG: hypothetical protein JSV77_03505 [Dehalococcoidales bacterium]|nr:MAG: hypothetical protein JSV77_03505 [Dehalococcoidales bacterium]